MPILDHRGNPISTSKLRIEDDDKAMVWRSHRGRWSPVVALQLSALKLQTIFDNADNGDHTDLMTLAQEIEQRDLHIRAVLQTRKLSVAGIPVAVESASEDAADVRVADELRDAVKVGKFRDAVLHLLDAPYKGFSVVEMTWAQDFGSVRFKDRDPREFAYDAATMRTLHRRQIGGFELIPMRPGKYIVHEPKMISGTPIAGGLCRPLAILYLLKSFALKDWSAFAEVFGFPVRIGKHPPNSPQEVKDALLSAMQSIGTDAAAIISSNMEMELMHGVQGQGGDRLFEGLATFANREISKGVLGQTLTTEQGSVGSLALAEVQERVRYDIRDHDAEQISGTLTEQYAHVWTQLRHGEGVAVPRISIKHQDPEDLEALGGFLWPAIQNGLQVPQAWVREKIQAPEPEAGEPVMVAPGSSIAPADEPQQPTAQ